MNEMNENLLLIGFKKILIRMNSISEKSGITVFQKIRDDYGKWIIM